MERPIALLKNLATPTYRYKIIHPIMYNANPPMGYAKNDLCI